MGCLEDRFPVLAVGGGKPRRDTLYSKYMGKEFEHSIRCVLHVHLQHTLHHNDLSSNHQSLKWKQKISNLDDVKSLVTIHNLLLHDLFFAQANSIILDVYWENRSP